MSEKCVAVEQDVNRYKGLILTFILQQLIGVNLLNLLICRVNFKILFRHSIFRLLLLLLCFLFRFTCRLWFQQARLLLLFLQLSCLFVTINLCSLNLLIFLFVLFGVYLVWFFAFFVLFVDIRLVKLPLNFENLLVWLVLFDLFVDQPAILAV